jgi:hypothetical protein
MSADGDAIDGEIKPKYNAMVMVVGFISWFGVFM